MAMAASTAVHRAAQKSTAHALVLRHPETMSAASSSVKWAPYAVAMACRAPDPPAKPSASTGTLPWLCRCALLTSPGSMPRMPAAVMTYTSCLVTPRSVAAKTSSRPPAPTLSPASQGSTRASIADQSHVASRRPSGGTNRGRIRRDRVRPTGPKRSRSGA